MPYVWGGESRREGGFDCSGLIWAAYRNAGVSIGRTTYQQIHDGHAVNWRRQALRPGDLVFTNHGDHVVMYAGHGKVIAAPHTGTDVQVQELSIHRGSIVAVRRIVPGGFKAAGSKGYAPPAVAGPGRTVRRTVMSNFQTVMQSLNQPPPQIQPTVTLPKPQSILAQLAEPPTSPTVPAPTLQGMTPGPEAFDPRSIQSNLDQLRRGLLR